MAKITPGPGRRCRREPSETRSWLRLRTQRPRLSDPNYFPAGILMGPMVDMAKTSPGPFGVLAVLALGSAETVRTGEIQG